MKRLRPNAVQMDRADAAILKALAANARVTTADLARAIGLSPPSTAERVKRLEEAGVIRGYRAEIDPAAIGLALAAIIRIRPMPGQLQAVAALLDRMAEIVECHRVTGDDCFIATAHVASIVGLEKLIDQILPLATTNTAIVQSSPVPRRMPPVMVKGS